MFLKTLKVLPIFILTVWFFGLGTYGSKLEASHGNDTKNNCPAPFKRENGKCVLKKDKVIKKPLVLTSELHIDCKDHTLSAKFQGTPAIDTTGTGYSPSKPELAFHLNNVSDVIIENCTIEGFDFGVVINGERSLFDKYPNEGGNKVKNNTIIANYNGINLIRTNNNEIEENSIFFARGARGKGIWMQNDSDRNVIEENEIMAADGNLCTAANVFVPLLPGSNRFNNLRCDAIRVERWGVREGAQFGLNLLNMVIEKKLFQFATTDWDIDQQCPIIDAGAPLISEQWGEDNQIEDNMVDMETTGSDAGTFAISVGGGHTNITIVENYIAGGGAHFSGPNSEYYTIPGICSMDPSRVCFDDSDCNLSIDKNSNGVCTNTNVKVVTQGVCDSSISGNDFPNGLANTAVSYFGTRDIITTFNNIHNPMIVNNIIEDSDGAGIFLIGKDPLETAVVTNNIVINSEYLVRLRKEGTCIGLPPGETCGSPDATVFDAVFSMNDFNPGALTLNPEAIALSGVYDIPTELSFESVGNYWGHSSGSCFLPSDSPDFSLIKDSFPFCVAFQ